MRKQTRLTMACVTMASVIPFAAWVGLAPQSTPGEVVARALEAIERQDYAAAAALFATEVQEAAKQQHVQSARFTRFDRTEGPQYPPDWPECVVTFFQSRQRQEQPDVQVSIRDQTLLGTSSVEELEALPASEVLARMLAAGDVNRRMVAEQHRMRQEHPAAAPPFLPRLEREVLAEAVVADSVAYVPIRFRFGAADGRWSEEDNLVVMELRRQASEWRMTRPRSLVPGFGSMSVFSSAG